MVTSVIKDQPHESTVAHQNLAGLLQDISRELEGLRYGQVVIKIHDGRAVAIERVSRLRRDGRVDSADSAAAPA